MPFRPQGGATYFPFLLRFYLDCVACCWQATMGTKSQKLLIKSVHMKSTNNEKITSLQKFHWFVTDTTFIFKHKKESSGKQLPPSVQFYYQRNKSLYKFYVFLCRPSIMSPRGCPPPRMTTLREELWETSD